MAREQIKKMENDVNDVLRREMSRPAGDEKGHLRSSSREIPFDNRAENGIATWRIATWNVRTMLRAGKLENVKREMDRLKINVCGLSEVRWRNWGDFYSDRVRVLYSGGGESQRGVAILLDIKAAQSIEKVVRHEDRIIMVRLKAKPKDLVIVQVYMPTSKHEDDEVERMYDKMEEIIEQERNCCTIIMGDFNAVVGEGSDTPEIGKFGLGKRNARGQKLVDFCRRTKHIVTNTMFQQPQRRRYTWTDPKEDKRYQLDYILVSSRYRNSVKKSCSYPGADADTDHNPVIMKTRIQLKKVRAPRRPLKWNLEALKKEDGSKFVEYIEDKVLQEKQSHDIDERWRVFRDNITESAKINIGREKKKIRKPWVTEEMMNKMEERRKWKNSGTTEGKARYRKLNNELRRITDKAKEDWLTEQCKEIEELNRRGRSDLMYRKVKDVVPTKRRTVSARNINNKEGQLLTNPANVLERWKEYIEELYAKREKPEDIKIEDEDTVTCDSAGPDILDEEIEKAIKELKNNKATGDDDIPAEFLKQLQPKAMREFKEICKKIYIEGKWPEDYMTSVMIPIEKKPNATDCSDFRTISLISHASKVILKVLTRRIESKAKDFIGEEQFGFRKGLGTREAIGVLRQICERNLEHNRDVYVCYVDYEKAFDRVNWSKMMDILQDIGVDWRDRRLIKNLYMGQKVKVRTAVGETAACTIGRGNRQGCSLSPLLYTIYDEAIMKEAFQNGVDGVKVGGKLITSIRFADDKAIVGETEQALQRSMDVLNDITEKYGMKINVKKTKTMVVSRVEGKKINLQLKGHLVEQVHSFKYLGSTITDDGRCEQEIKIRIAMGKEAFNARKRLFTARMNLDLKKRMLKNLVWSVVLYAAETWTLKQAEINKLEAFEMWLWRRLMKISWTEKKSNAEVLQLVREERSLVKTIRDRKKQWIGHIMRHDNLYRDVLEGRMEGKPRKGRRRTRYIDDFGKKETYGSLKRKAEDRILWKGWTPESWEPAPA